MSVTDIVRDEIIYTDHWWTDDELPDVDYEKEIQKYNSNRGRFMFYPWGVFVTSYARKNVISGILEFGGDYIYSDTDSIKVRNAEKHLPYIERYNVLIRQKLINAMHYHNLPIEDIEPLTKDGIKKPLGVWDFDGHYSRFKTLGAKRYMVEYSDDPRNGKHRGELNITVSGLNKQKCVPYICTGWCYDRNTKTEHNSPFNVFSDEMYIPPEHTGKMTHTYIDERRTGTVIDYMGVPGEYDELSGVHLMNADYSLEISREYSDYLLDIRNKEV